MKEAKADEPPAGPLGLDAKGDGPPDGFGLRANPGGRGLVGSGGAGSRWGWYATIVQSQIEAALRAHPKTRDANMQIQVRLWSDSTGRISRVQLVTSTGDGGLDAVLRAEILGGLMLKQPPPKDMPMPIVMRITERKAS
jgi:outer membrane biosynthesis protein TonB